MRRKFTAIGLVLLAACAFMAVGATAASATPNWTVETSGGTVSIPGKGAEIPFDLTAASTEGAVVTLEAPGLLTLSGKGVHIEGGIITGEKLHQSKN